MDIKNSPVSAAQLGAMIARIIDNTISSKGGKDVFAALWEQKGDDVDALIDSLGLKQVSDTGAIEAIVDEVIVNSPFLMIR